MKALLTIRRLLVALALAGLIIAPVARAAIAIPADDHAAMMDMSSADVAGGMPCCPEDKAPMVDDCAKACVAICAVSIFQLASAVGGVLPTTQFTRLAPVSDVVMSGLGQAPPPRPPKA